MITLRYDKCVHSVHTVVQFKHVPWVSFLRDYITKSDQNTNKSVKMIKKNKLLEYSVKEQNLYFTFRKLSRNKLRIELFPFTWRKPAWTKISANRAGKQTTYICLDEKITFTTNVNVVYKRKLERSWPKKKTVTCSRSSHHLRTFL